MKRRLEETLEECLAALARGQSTLEECLALYPELAAELEPLLHTARRLQDGYAVDPSPLYAQAARENPDPLRERKLLMHRREIDRLAIKVNERGLTLVPLSLYWKDGRAKVELALVRGKRRHDKREPIRRRETDRELARAMRGKGRRRS